MEKKVIVAVISSLLLLSVSANVFYCRVPDKFQKQFVSDASYSRDTSIDVLKNFPEAEKAFRRVFRHAAGTKCVKLPDALLFHFTLDGQRGSAVLSERGVIRYAIIDQSISKIPTGIHQKIQKQYPGYRLFYAKEITSRHSSSLYLVIENSQKYISLMVEEGEFSEMKRLVKMN